MDRFLVFVVICGLGSACGGIVRRNVPSTQQNDGLQGLTGLATQFMTNLAAVSQQNQPTQTTGSGSQFNAGLTNGSVIENGFRGLFSNNGQAMNYDFSEAMQMLNPSYGIPASPSINTSQMTREQFLKHVQEQSKKFNDVINSEMTMMLEPDRVVKYLNVTTRASDPKITNNPEALAALQMEFQDLMIDFQNKLQEKLNGEKSTRPADPVDTSAVSLSSLQQQVSALASMYNSELSQAMKPDDIAGALSGSDQGMTGMTQNLGTAVMNIFQSISRSDPSNGPTSNRTSQ